MCILRSLSPQGLLLLSELGKIENAWRVHGRHAPPPLCCRQVGCMPQPARPKEVMRHDL